MNENKQQAWRVRCSQLEALGLDAYDPLVPADDSRQIVDASIFAECLREHVQSETLHN